MKYLGGLACASALSLFAGCYISLEPADEFGDARADVGGDAVNDAAIDAAIDAANDAGRDVPVDQRAVETGLCVPSTEVCNGFDDDCNGLTDEGLDCGNCAGSFDPMDSWYYFPSVEVSDADETAMGNGVFTGLQARIPPMVASPMVQRAGDCLYDPAAPFASARDEDLGALRASQPGMLDLSTTFDPTSRLYHSVSADGDLVVDGRPVRFDFAGGADGPASSAFVLAPTRLRASDIGWPMTIQRGRTATFRFTPAESTADQMAVLFLLDGDVTASGTLALTLCAVPLCRGALTVPAEITSNYADTRQIAYLRFVRTQTLGQYTPPVRARVSYGVTRQLELQ